MTTIVVLGAHLVILLIVAGVLVGADVVATLAGDAGHHERRLQAARVMGGALFVFVLLAISMLIVAVTA